VLSLFGKLRTEPGSDVAAAAADAASWLTAMVYENTLATPTRKGWDESQPRVWQNGNAIGINSGD
jgi:hypothetical protein